MPRAKLFIIPAIPLLAAAFILSGCNPEERIIQEKVIQIGENEIQPQSEFLYSTHKIKGPDGKEVEYTRPSMDFSAVDKPDLEEFTRYFHQPVQSQGMTGTCWCFAATSLLESELHRLGRPDVKLSEIHTVYWEFLEKARRFIREKGNSHFSHGSEINAVIERMKSYGAVRASDYSGLLGDAEQHNHGAVFKEMNDYLQFCKQNDIWDEEQVMEYIKSILNKHLGTPPETIDVEGSLMTPKEYFDNLLQLPLDDYVSFVSTKAYPFYNKAEFRVPDNWWHSKDYFNVPLDDFYQGIVTAVKNGFTVGISGDVSEPGNSSRDEWAAVIPSFDIPQFLIDQDSREFRFSNRTSTDDHAIHIVGYKEDGDHMWFLIKDSAGGGAEEGPMRHHYFMRDDYLKLKILAFTVHKDAVPELLSTIAEKKPESSGK